MFSVGEDVEAGALFKRGGPSRPSPVTWVVTARRSVLISRANGHQVPGGPIRPTPRRLPASITDSERSRPLPPSPSSPTEATVSFTWTFLPMNVLMTAKGPIRHRLDYCRARPVCQRCRLDLGHHAVFTDPGKHR